MSIKHIDPTGLQERLQQGEPHEFEFCQIEGAVNIPLRQIREAADQFETEDPIVVYCHHGPRSMMAAGALNSLGFEDVTNLDGGIDGWAAEVDPSLPRY